MAYTRTTSITPLGAAALSLVSLTYLVRRVLTNGHVQLDVVSNDLSLVDGASMTYVVPSGGNPAPLLVSAK